MRDFNTDPLADLPTLPAEIVNRIIRITVLAILGYSALYGLMLTGILGIISIFFTLPFSPMWGFVTVLLGGIFALFAAKRLENVK